jgi:F0F1-type ATP synthase assembly protein I
MTIGEKGESVSKNEDFEYTSIYNKSVKFVLIVSLVLVCLFYRNLSYALGFLLGGTACIINFRLMVKSFEGLFINTNNTKAFFNGYSLRLIIVTVVLAAAIKLESINLVTTVIGILTINLIITWVAISKYIKKQ